MSHALSIQSVSKSFPHHDRIVHAVDNVSLAIRENEFFTLLGPSGCGKTTLLRLIAGLEAADSGHILLSGEDITALPPHRRPVNTVFQSYALFPHMTVEDNIAFGLRMQGKRNINEDVAKALQLIRLEDLSARKPAQLSGGQQQRVALARALINRPKILLLDESLSALDYKLRKDMQMELKRLQRDTGITFVFVTHDQDEALSMSDRIAVMDQGRVVQTGTPQEIYHRPATRFVAGFVGICNFVKMPGIGEVGFRPEDAAFSGDTMAAQGKLLHINYRGAITHYMVQLDSGESVTLAADERQSVQTGDHVGISINPEKLIRCVA